MRAAATVVAVAFLVVLPTPAAGSYQLLTTWGKYGSGDDRFFNPAGVATDSRDNVYVADAGNARIKKYDSSGSLITQWGGEGRFEAPWGIAVDATDNVYVADPLADEISKFDSDGRPLASWGGSGSSQGEFRGPTGVAADGRGGIYVVEASLCGGTSCPRPNNRVQKFDTAGNFVAEWGGLGDGEGEFDSPYGIATDPEGNVYVADAGNARVQKFDSDGNFITVWGVWGWAGEGEFSYPWSVATDSDNSVYVADTGNDRVQKFADLTQTKIGSGPPRSTLDNTPTFSFSADRPGCEFECSLGSTAFAACRPPYTTPLLAEGRYSFRVRARDRQGVTDPTPAARDFFVVPGVDAYASARRKQVQSRGIVVKARARAKEQATISARGKVRAGSAYPLGSRSFELAEDTGKTVKLEPKKRRHRKRIARALRQGKKVTARLRLKLVDEAGNRRTERFKVRLKR